MQSQSNRDMIQPFLNCHPRLDHTNFVAPSADVIGDVVLGAHSSVWFNATIRGDVHWIRIGQASNVQDNAVVHVTNGKAPTRIGDYVTIGHSAVIHGCTIENNVLVGMGAVILDHAVVGCDSMIGARALVTQSVRIPPRSLVLGVPGRVVRELIQEEVLRIRSYSDNYVGYSAIYLGQEAPSENPFYEPADDLTRITTDHENKH